MTSPLLPFFLLHLAPMIPACIIYSGQEIQYHGYLSNATIIAAGETVCNFTGSPGNNGLFQFTCDPGFTAVQTPDTGFVQFTLPTGDYDASTNFTATAVCPGGVCPEHMDDWEACAGECNGGAGLCPFGDPVRPN